MIRFISVAVFVVLFLILSIPLMIAEWIIGKFNMDVKNRSSLAIVNWAFRWCLRLSGVKITYIGEERVPRDQAVLYIGNHRSYFDILMTYVRVPRPTGYVAKIEMLKIPLLSNWMKNLHCLFLHFPGRHPQQGSRHFSAFPCRKLQNCREIRLSHRPYCFE